MHSSRRVGGASSSAQGWQHHRRVACSPRRNLSQPIHQSLEHSLLLVVIAVAHPGAAGVAPDFGGHEEEAEPRGRQSRVPQLGGILLRFAVEQHQPTVQVSCRVPDYAGSLPSNPPWPSFSATFSVWRQIEFGIIRLSSPYWVVKPVRRSHARTFFPKLSNSETFPRHI